MYIVLRRAFSEVRIKLSIYLSISAKGKEEKNKITDSVNISRTNICFHVMDLC